MEGVAKKIRRLRKFATMQKYIFFFFLFLFEKNIFKEIFFSFEIKKFFLNILLLLLLLLYI